MKRLKHWKDAVNLVLGAWLAVALGARPFGRDGAHRQRRDCRRSADRRCARRDPGPPRVGGMDRTRARIVAGRFAVGARVQRQWPGHARRHGNRHLDRGSRAVDSVDRQGLQRLAARAYGAVRLFAAARRHPAAAGVAARSGAHWLQAEAARPAVAGRASRLTLEAVMTIPSRLSSYLEQRGVHYEVCAHQRSRTNSPSR